MADDNEAIAPALETPASGEQEQEVETTETEGTADEQQLDGDEGQDEEDELDFGFEKYRVPRKLKEAVEALRADATTKHQTAAARQKALDEREAALTQQAEVTEAELDAKADLRTVSKTLDEYAKLTQADWDAHEANDPLGTQKAWRYYQHLKDQKAELEDKLGKAATERTQKAQQDLAKRVEQTLAEAPKIIPGFKPETIKRLAEFANGDLGIDEETIKKNWSPTFLKLLHLANLGQELSKKAAAKSAPPPAQPAPPLKVVSAKAVPSPSGLNDKLPQDEWVKRFRKRMAEKTG